MPLVSCLQALGASAESRRFGASQVVTERLRGQHVADVVKGTSCNHAPGHMQKGPRSAKQVKDATPGAVCAHHLLQLNTHEKSHVSWTPHVITCHDFAGQQIC